MVQIYAPVHEIDKYTMFNNNKHFALTLTGCGHTIELKHDLAS